MFSGKIIYIDAEFSFKEKQETTKKIKENGGQIAAVLSSRKPADIFVLKDQFKISNQFKFFLRNLQKSDEKPAINIVGIVYIEDCLVAGRLLEIDELYKMEITLEQEQQGYIDLSNWSPASTTTTSASTPVAATVPDTKKPEKEPEPTKEKKKSSKSAKHYDSKEKEQEDSFVFDQDRWKPMQDLWEKQGLMKEVTIESAFREKNPDEMMDELIQYITKSSTFPISVQYYVVRPANFPSNIPSNSIQEMQVHERFLGNYHIVKEKLFHKLKEERITFGIVELHAYEESVNNTMWRIFIEISDVNVVLLKQLQEQLSGLISNDAVANTTQLYCVCQKEAFGFMIDCVSCGKWFHGKCVGVSERNKHAGYTCADCLRKLYAEDDEEEEEPIIPNANIKGIKKCLYVDSIQRAESLFATVVNEIQKFSKFEVSVLPVPPSGLGSDRAMEIRGSSSTGLMSPEVSEFVDYIYNENSSKLNSMLSVSLSNISPPTLDEAESVLMHIHQLLMRHKTGEITEEYLNKKGIELSNTFFNLVPCRVHPDETLMSIHALSEKQALIQMMKDTNQLNEMNVGSLNSLENKYKALQCNIKNLKKKSQQYQMVKALIDQDIDSYYATQNLQGDDENDIEIVRVFSVERMLERDSNADPIFSSIGNKRLLFHGSKISNFCGILSRGLLLPKIVTNLVGGNRTDGGMLGSGIYFSDSIITSLKYCTRDQKRSTCFVAVAEVALGSVKEFAEIQPSLNKPPTGYDSVRGVKSSQAMRTEFLDNEFVVYQVSQQKIRYIVEVEVSHRLQIALEPSSGYVGLNKAVASDVKEEGVVPASVGVNAVSEPECGLIGDGQELALEHVQVECTVIDVLAKISIYQQYYNSQSREIEAKYIFPTDENSAVCGFEAFINEKHVVAKAHREYQEAITQGKGAYLLDEEEPDLFVCSVGNIPPLTRVVIKIDVVVELPMKDADVCLRIPSRVAPSKKQKALTNATQTHIQSVNISGSGATFGFYAEINMLDDVLNITSPSHNIKFKKSGGKAAINLVGEPAMLEKDLIILIRAANIHSPRMWVESDPKGHQAIMSVFYPQFNTKNMHPNDFLFIVDLSTSMRGQSLEDAKRHLLISLNELKKRADEIQKSNKEIPNQPLLKFNILIFGSSYNQLFISSKPVNESNIQDAIKFVKELNATYGGTNLWNVLKSLILLSSLDNYSKNLILFTDGYLTESEKIMQLLSNSSLSTKGVRLFMFGVGSDPNRHLISTLARIGGGTYEILPSKKQSTTKVVSQIERAFQPCCRNIKIEWVPTSPTFQSPAIIPSLFHGERRIVYAFIDSYVTHASLTAEMPNEEKIATSVRSTGQNFIQGSIIHTLAALGRIRDFENGIFSEDTSLNLILKRDKQEEVVELAIKHNLASKFTSFIAIEERIQKKAKEDEEQEDIETPTAEELAKSMRIESLGDDVHWDMDNESMKVEAAYLKKLQQMEYELKKKELEEKRIREERIKEQKRLEEEKKRQEEERKKKELEAMKKKLEEERRRKEEEKRKEEAKRKIEEEKRRKKEEERRRMTMSDSEEEEAVGFAFDWDAPVASAAAAEPKKKEEKKAHSKREESKEDEDEGVGFGAFSLFDGNAPVSTSKTEVDSGRIILGDAELPKKKVLKGELDFTGSSTTSASNFLKSLLGAVKIQTPTQVFTTTKSSVTAASASRSKKEKSSSKPPDPNPSLPSLGGKVHGGLGGRSGGGPGRFKQLVAWKKDRTFNFITEKAPIDMSKSIDAPTKKAPWGFDAIPTDSPSSKKTLGYLFKGPINSNATCWLDAILALGLSLSFEFYKKCQRVRELTPAEQIPEGNFFDDIFQFFKFWVEYDHGKVDFREKMKPHYEKVWKRFQKLGFTSGEPFRAIDAFNEFLTQIDPYGRKSWEVSKVNSWDLTGITPSRNSKYWIIFNEKQGNFSLQDVPGYQVISMITFEPLFYDNRRDKEINHYLCSMFDGEWIWLYDDLLSLPNGGFQGGCFLSEDKRLQFLYKHVPIVILKRKEM